ncbi:MAG: NADPH-dependent 7-cyano-7-deazaguanine reductase QueF [Succinivibrio sp.]|nr:NADPH-dependent 7-cyano-7-deazaguanine reductase QueF [Succinivibrio sp.]
MSKSASVLGKNTSYFDEYNPKILNPIDRTMGRAPLRMQSFEGYDLWRFYELTWLDTKGIPHTAMGSIKVPATSPCIVESKSLKLYLGSFAMTKITGISQLQQIIEHDLVKKLDCAIEVKIYECSQPVFEPETPNYLLIDNEITAENEISRYEYAPELLKHNGTDFVEEAICSNVLRTLCPVTGQPDHASVFIRYSGTRIDHQGLFAYLVSLRNHRGFHEQCCELIFSDIKTLLTPKNLCVCACFTRRGGIDINPVRSDYALTMMPPRTLRQ